MQKNLVLLLVVLLLGQVLVSCAPGVKNQDTMMEPKPTEAVMEEKMPVTGEETEMNQTATPEMASEMMDVTGTPEMMEKADDPMMATETSQASMMEEKDPMMAPAWFNAELTNVGSGESFRIEDFKGKVVLVETFAQWCPTCLSQQKEMARLHEMLGMTDDLVTVSLDVDPKEDAEMLKMYLAKHGLDWYFAIAPTETAREIGSLYGQQFLNPPSAPMLIIDRKGEVHTLPFGVKSAEDLQEALKTYLDSGM